MGIRPSFKSKDCNVQVHLGSDYDTVKFVADNMEFLKGIEASAKIFMMYLGEHAEAPTTRLDGSPIEDGDFYLNITHNYLSYAVVPESGDITWVSVDIELIESYAIRAEQAMNSAITASNDAHNSMVDSTAASQAAYRQANIALTASRESIAARDKAQEYRDESSVFHSQTNNLKNDVVSIKQEIDDIKVDIDATSNLVQVNKNATDANLAATEDARDTSMQAAAAAEESKNKSEEWAVSPSTNNSAKYWAEEAKKAATSSVISGGPFTPTSSKEYPTLPTSFMMRPDVADDAVLPDIYYIVYFEDPTGSYTWTTGDLATKTAHNQYMMYFDRKATEWTLVPAPTVTLEMLGGVRKAGDTMTGNLIIESAKPAFALKSGSKEWKVEATADTVNITENGVANVISMKAGGETTIRKPRAQSTQENHAAALIRKDYADTELDKKVSKAGDTMTGDLVVNTMVTAKTGLKVGTTPIKVIEADTNKVNMGDLAHVKQLDLHAHNGVVVVATGSDEYLVFHEGNKPHVPDVMGTLTIDFGRID